MPETLAGRLEMLTSAMIVATIRQEAGDDRPQALDAARLAILLCDAAGIGAHEPVRAPAYELALLRIQAAVQGIAGMRYMAGMT